MLLNEKEVGINPIYLSSYVEILRETSRHLRHPTYMWHLIVFQAKTQPPEIHRYLASPAAKDEAA